MKARNARNVYCTYDYCTKDGKTGTITKTWRRQTSSKAARDFAAEVTAHALDSGTTISLRIEVGADHECVLSTFCDGQHYHLFCHRPDGSVAHRYV